MSSWECEPCTGQDDSIPIILSALGLIHVQSALGLNINSMYLMLQVKMTVFLSYCRALGLINSILILIFFLLYQVASVYSSVWLSLWTDDEYLQDESNVNKTEYADKRDMYLGVYGGLGVAQGMC